MKPVLLENWAPGNKSWRGVEGLERLQRDFDIILMGAKIILAWYGDGDYSGKAFVLFEKDGGLFEVNASHCSCDGVEGQWDPESVTVKELQHRLDEGKLGSSYYEGNDLFKEELRKVLKRLARRFN